jgi:septal ring factor EnvC (AmiA/AmiB activator)
MKNTVFIYALLLIFSISNTALYGGWFDEEQKSQELEEIKKKQDLFEQKLNQIVKKIDDLQTSVNKIKTAPPTANFNKKNNNKRDNVEYKCLAKIEISGKTPAGRHLYSTLSLLLLFFLLK